jgi:hypothetical protein
MYGAFCASYGCSFNSLPGYALRLRLIFHYSIVQTARLERLDRFVEKDMSIDLLTAFVSDCQLCPEGSVEAV